MRLLNTETLEIREFITKIPDYAVLSHTWGDEEVSFQDLTLVNHDQTSDDSNIIRDRSGYRKIGQFCRRAREDGFAWAWADTCCIDKTSSAELSEAINSMYKWYQQSAICYVYLEDVEPQPPFWIVNPSKAVLERSRWFTRGWTLQELIAPENIVFLARDWSDLGSKFSLESILVNQTKVPAEIFHGQPLTSRSVAERMSWASSRRTTREEDVAYCLLGIFGIHMPLLYGEGGKEAFLRLQEEIWKREEDLTLLMW
ncbi:heterokaryon incompatibility protein-domain-containing protein, partial [Podospora aff. communis PSN243]